MDYNHLIFILFGIQGIVIPLSIIGFNNSVKFTILFKLILTLILPILLTLIFVTITEYTYSRLLTSKIFWLELTFPLQVLLLVNYINWRCKLKYGRKFIPGGRFNMSDNSESLNTTLKFRDFIYTFFLVFIVILVPILYLTV